jgi:hypothetical protein
VKTRTPVADRLRAVFGKLALVLGFLVLLVVAVRLSGAPLIPRGEEPSAANRPDSVNPEAERLEWLDQVTAICDWERKQAKALVRVYRQRSIGAPKDVELMLLAVIRMGDESKAIFNRLTPPFEYRREVRELRSRFRQERRALESLVAAVRNVDRRAFFRGWRGLATANARKVDTLRNLGLRKCVTGELPATYEKSDPTIV